MAEAPYVDYGSYAAAVGRFGRLSNAELADAAIDSLADMNPPGQPAQDREAAIKGGLVFVMSGGDAPLTLGTEHPATLALIHEAISRAAGQLGCQVVPMNQGEGVKDGQ